MRVQGTTPTYAICSPNTERACFAKHVLDVTTTHTMTIAGPRKRPTPEDGESPRDAHARARTAEAAERENCAEAGPSGTARRRI